MVVVVMEMVMVYCCPGDLHTFHTVRPHVAHISRTAQTHRDAGMSCEIMQTSIWQLMTGLDISPVICCKSLSASWREEAVDMHCTRIGAHESCQDCSNAVVLLQAKAS